MFKKNTDLNKWLWKWHMISGLITMPFMLLLAVTGVIYLFKADVNEQLYQSTLYIKEPENLISKTKLSYQEQLSAAAAYSNNEITSMTVPTDNLQSTEFKIKSKGFATNFLYINPYTAEITGQIDETKTFIRKVRKLHGELLLGTPGTLVIELVASWFLVLILTGVYIWWPTKANGNPGFFTIRRNKGKRLFWRDLHAVTGFWLSILLLAVLAGGMPWTNIFGSNLKWVQIQTDSGYPKNWSHAKGLESTIPANILTASNTSISNDSSLLTEEFLSTTISADKPLTLDMMVNLATYYQLQGDLMIGLPNSPKGVYTIANQALFLSDQQVIHIDQYSGGIIEAYEWSDVGFLMDLRQVFMRFHQGEYGLINWIVMLSVGVFFGVMNLAGLISYLKRKSKGSWSIPSVPSRFNVGVVLIAIIIFIGVLFPLFGGSLLLIWLWEKRKLFFTKV